MHREAYTMKMKTLIYTILALTFWTKLAISQDTTYLDPKVEYFSKDRDIFNTRYKSKYYPTYSKEKIRIAKDSFKVEYCYYLDNKRNASNFIQYYRILNDTIILPNNEKWSFKIKKDNTFNVKLQYDNVIEKGTVTLLIPFEKHGDFYTMNNQHDTLYIEHFEAGNYISTTVPKINLKDSVYLSVDKPPIFPSKHGDLQTYILSRVRFPEIYAESSIQGNVYIKAVVTSNGKVRNVEVLRGVDPPLDNEAVKVIAKLPDFMPGKINGKSVNYYIVMPVKFILQ